MASSKRRIFLLSTLVAFHVILATAEMTTITITPPAPPAATITLTPHQPTSQNPSILTIIKHLPSIIYEVFKYLIVYAIIAVALATICYAIFLVAGGLWVTAGWGLDKGKAWWEKNKEGKRARAEELETLNAEGRRGAREGHANGRRSMDGDTLLGREDEGEEGSAKRGS